MIYDAREIEASVERLAAEIAADYRGQPLVLLGVLKGALCFTSDLARALAGVPDGPSEIMVDYLCVERYGAAGADAAPPRLAMDSKVPLAGQNVVVIDGIADKGSTLAFVGALIERGRPASLRNCVLFDKRGSREADLQIDYAGLPVGNLFVIGYGLDYKEMYRNLPYLSELREGQNGLTSS
jgi:hypoxanthine phosphoribosyltransferase